MWRVFGSTVAVVAVTLLLTSETWPTQASDPEVTRIRQHLSRVSERLRANPPRALSPTQLAARLQALDWLDEYKDVGPFPHNHVRPAERVPVFVDPHGTPCAVGYLMLRTGAQDLVEQVVRRDNLIRVPELEGDERFTAWLDSVGLTLEEAALIQPAYGPRPDPERSSTLKGTTVGLAVITAALTSYASMTGLEAERPVVDFLTVGTAVGHAIVLAHGGDERFGGADWPVVVNAAGALVGAWVELLRVSGSDSGLSSEPGLHAYVAPWAIRRGDGPHASVTRPPGRAERDEPHTRTRKGT